MRTTAMQKCASILFFWNWTSLVQDVMSERLGSMHMRIDSFASKDGGMQIQSEELGLSR